jgi:hypothetical protein
MRSLSFLALPVLAAAITTLPAERAGAVAGGFAVDYAIRNFTRVALGTAAQMQVRVGPNWSVHADGPAAILATMRIERDGDTLKVVRRDPKARGDAALERQVRVTVTMPRLSAAALGGNGTIAINRVSGPHFDASVGGQGAMTIAALTTDAAEVSIGGTGSVVASGRVRDLKVSIGGAGSLRAPALHAAHADVSVAGSGTVLASVEGDASVSSIGRGTIDLGPRARCDVSKMGGARIRCGA